MIHRLISSSTPSSVLGRVKFASLLGLATVLPALAEIKINDNLGISGFTAGSYQYSSLKGAPSSDSFDVDAAKLNFNAKFDKVTSTIGFYYTPTSTGSNNVTIIEANVTYDAGNGVSVTGGKFLSWFGYEAFDQVNKLQVSSAYINRGGTVMFYPAYHEGVTVQYSDSQWSSGVALLDSVFGPTIYRGDGELKHNAGFEGFVSYKGVKDLTVWAGIAYDTKGNKSYQTHSDTVYNIWASYQVGQALLAAEYIYNDGGPGAKGSTGLVLVDYSFTKELSTTFRISTGKLDDLTPSWKGLGFTKFTVSPAYKVTQNLLIRPEISYIKYRNNGPLTSETFYALQAVFKL
jgi:hypothetical protein